jgi:hypothetical protein
MVVGTTNGQHSLTFLDHLTKTIGANTTTGKLPSRRKEQRQQNRINNDDQLFRPYLKRMCGEAQIPGHFTNQGIRPSAISMRTRKGVLVITLSYVLSDSLSTPYNFYI